MKLVMHNPTRNFGRFFDSDTFFDTLNRDEFPAYATPGTRPKVNIVETDSSFTLMAEVPGLTGKDIDIEMKDGILTLKGKSGPEEDTAAEGTVHIREIDAWNFERDFRLGEQVDPDGVTARLENGVLFVSLAKKEKAKPRKVEIKVAS